MNGKEVKNKWFVITWIVIIVFVCLITYGYLKPFNFNFKIPETINISQTSNIKILIVGDIMLDRNVRNIIDKKGFNYFFKGAKELVQNADIAIGNLEGSFTTNLSVTSDLINKDLQFTFDPSLASALSNLGFDVLGLANNHSFNYGTAGLEMTRRYIGGSGMFYYGDPFNIDEISTIITKNGIKVGIVGFHEFYYINFDKVLAEIARLRPEVDVLIVTPHWGIEYNKTPTDLQKKLARQFIDTGADAVIGAHSHVIGEIEEYKGKKIFYSLGNFAFDQYFSKATTEGLTVVMDVKKENSKIDLNYTLIPVKVDREGVRVATTTTMLWTSTTA